MRLIKIQVENFRAIRHLEMDVSPLTALFGDNGCGKSSLFEALDHCLGWSQRQKGLEWSEHDRHRCAQTAQPAGPIRIRLQFQCEKDTAGAELFRQAGLLETGSFWLEVRSDPSVSEFQAGRVRICDGQLLQALRRLCPVIRLQRGILKAPLLTSRHPLAQAVQAVFQDLLQSDQVAPALVERALQRLKEKSHLLERRGQAASVQARVEAPLGHPSDLAALLQGAGSRTLALLLLAATLLEATDSEVLPQAANIVVLLDEPDAGLHPSAVATIWSLLEALPAQKMVSTFSPDLLASVPLGSLRRLVRRSDGQVNAYAPRPEHFDASELRRAGYHIRVRRGTALLMRAWLLVEGESEFWLCHEAARACGFDLLHESVACLEFAQAGLVPMVALAQNLGIPWFLLADGDKAGQTYTREARKLRGGQVFQLAEDDLEHCLWAHGYEHVYRAAAPSPGRNTVSAILHAAVKHKTKPHLALLVGEQMVAAGAAGVPPVLRRMLEASVQASRLQDPFAELTQLSSD